MRQTAAKKPAKGGVQKHSRAALLLHRADTLLKEKRPPAKTLALSVTNGPSAVAPGPPSVADCLRSAPELMLSWGKVAGRWLDMVADIPALELTQGSGLVSLSLPATLADSYDFQLETEVLKSQA